MTNAVFIPGLLCTEALYEAQIAALGGIDISIGNHRQHDSMERIARHILNEAPETFLLAGLSMGGYIAFEIMRQAPERVSALILMDTSARPDAPEQTERRKGLVVKAENEGIGPVIEELIPHFLAERHHKRTDLRLAVTSMANEIGVDAFARQQTAIMNRPDSRPSLDVISCPTLIIVGDEDALTPPDLAREIADGIAGSQLSVIEHCGHLATIEQPDAANAALKSFLEETGITV